MQWLIVRLGKEEGGGCSCRLHDVRNNLLFAAVLVESRSRLLLLVEKRGATALGCLHDLLLLVV